MKTFQNVTWRFSALAALIAALALISQSVQADPVLHGYWTFDNDTLDSGFITESSGYQQARTHDGVLVNKVVDGINGISFNPISGEGETGNNLSQYGNTGNYISFTNDSYAYILNTRITAEKDTYKNSFDFNGGAFSISAWVKGLPDSDWEPYISKYGESSYGYQLRKYQNANYPTFTYRASGAIDDPTPNIDGVNTNLNDNSWHHLIAVYGGTYRDLYMDGQLICHVTDTVVDCSGTDEPLVFSARYEPSAYKAFANISLDDVAIYSGALRSNQIEWLSQGGDPTQLPASAPKTYSIPLNSPSASDDITLTPNGNISRHWLDTDIAFDGQSSFIRTNLHVGTAGLNGSFTASAWVYLNDTKTHGDNDQSIFGNNTQDSNYNSLHLVVRDGKPHMGFWSNDLTADTTLDAKKWYYITWQYDAKNETQKIYLDGVQIATRTGAAAFTGTNVLDIGKTRNANSYYLDGKLKGISISNDVLTTDQIKAQMKASWNNTTAIENFEWGKNDEWYSGGGASLGNAWTNGTLYTALSMFHAPSNAAEKTIVDQGNKDDTTGMVWGPQFTVLESAPDTATISFDVIGGNQPLDVSSRGNGGVGIALWDLKEKDYVRDENNNIIYRQGNNSNDLNSSSISLKGLQGHNLMIVNIDRDGNTYWSWAGLTNLTADVTQVSAIAEAAQHHIVLNDFNFDTVGDFNGMYEVDADGNRLESVTHFTNGSLDGNNSVTNYYVDCSGTFDKGKKGFLSSGTAEYGKEATTGILRSDPFLVQGDILEYYIAGGNNITNKHFDLIDAVNGEVYFSTSGENSDNFRYDFWNLKDIQGQSVYLQVVDADGGNDWGHLELDQIRQVKFAPTAAEVAASNKAFNSANLEFNADLPGFNAESYNNISSLDDLSDCIIKGVEPDNKYYQATINNFTAGAGYGVDIFSTLNVDASGQYTLAVTNDEAYRITLNGDTVYESDGSGNMEFIPLTFSETGQYALKMLYLDNSGEGVSLYMATGAFDSWNNDFDLLAGAGAGFVNSYAAYLVNGGGNGVPEPSTWALLILGAAGLLFWRKKSK